MPTSDWGRWLIDDIEAADPETIALWYLGCNGVAAKAPDGTILYIDPYLGLGSPPRTVRMIPVPFEPEAPDDAAALLITHEHTDHLHGPTQGPMLAATGATCYAPRHAIDLIEARGWIEAFDLDADQFVAVDAGDTLEIGGFTVGVHPCHDPDAAAPVSYHLETGDATIFHGGDGRPDPALEAVGESLDIDVAFCVYGSTGYIPDKESGEIRRTTWYNDANDTVHMADQLQAERLVPTHWDMWKGLTADPRGLIDHARRCPHPRRVEILEIGDRLDL